jgi:CoA:oxalate CoA-transferase
MHLSKTPTDVRRPPPELGEHTAEVLEEYGYSSTDIDRLREANAI